MSVLGISWKGQPQEIAKAKPIRRPKRKAKLWKITTGRLMLLALLGGAAIEALLGARLWAQLTAQSVDSGILLLVFDATEPLVSPFRGYEPSLPIKQTGILELATLIAIQAYLIAAIALLLLIGVLSAVIRFFFAPRREVRMPEPPVKRQKAGVETALSETVPPPYPAQQAHN